METLWTHRHEKIFSRQNAPGKRDQIHDIAVFAPSFACDGRSSVRKSSPLDVNIHRYEEHIAGRTYLIEVLPVSKTQWRAQIARMPGMPTALMPFYGHTPEEAAAQLSRWLTLVYNGNSKQ